ncbi:MAG: alpha/beta hydrolase [Rhodospirillales bacterium]|nr:MAG: alpha/beta hydrolase [Rhodospirillales bacterium]
MTEAADPLLISPVPGVALKRATANGLTMRYAEAGSGPLVLFCHGWPESWYSWRHQIVALAAAGFRCVAPDMRGYGGTDAPDEIERYTLLHMAGDMVELGKQLGESQAVIVGHDWGAPVAWNAAMLRPDVFRAVVGMSVPYAPPGHVDFLDSLDKAGIKTFYIQYFQKPGVAEAELERDIRATLRMLNFTASGDNKERGKGFAVLPPGGGLLSNCADPATLPAWLSEADLDYYTGEFTRTGFRGGLNWYRNMTRGWRLFGPWRGQPIHQPSMFIAGSRDGVLHFPASQAQIEAFPRTLPGIRGSHIVEGAGHWIQRERADTVNGLLIEFLRGL